MELFLLNLLVLTVFWVILTPVRSLRAYYMWLTRNQMLIREMWGKFTSFFFTSKFQKRELGNFIPNFPLKHVITSTKH